MTDKRLSAILSRLGLAIVFAVGLLNLPLTAKPRPDARPYFVAGSIARLRAAPKADAKVRARLRIGTELRVKGKKRQRSTKWKQVTTANGDQGWVRTSLLTTTRPLLQTLLDKAASTKSTRKRRTLLERATALAPGDLQVIGRLIANYKALGIEKAALSAEKGLIAAERRVLSWDGPLYPIKNSIALFPAPPFAGITATDRKTATIEKDRQTLRGRAFPLVNSGKVVALTEVGYRTRKLDAPVTTENICNGTAQAGFALQPPGKNGVLVPSWLVAGFRVYPLTGPLTGGNERATWHDAPGSLFVRRNGKEFLISKQGFAGQVLLYRGALGLTEGGQHLALEFAVPLLQFSEHERHVLILFRAPSARPCCLAGQDYWLERFEAPDPWPNRTSVEPESSPSGETPAWTRTPGRIYGDGVRETCRREIFVDLEGEPRCERLPNGCELSPPGLRQTK